LFEPGGLLQKTAAALLLQTIAVTADGDDVAVVSRRSRMAVAPTAARTTVPHSPTLRLLVIRMAPRSQRRLTSWKNRCAASGSNGK
jgi:hypothetical protein